MPRTGTAYHTQDGGTARWGERKWLCGLAVTIEGYSSGNERTKQLGLGNSYKFCMMEMWALMFALFLNLFMKAGTALDLTSHP